MQVDPNSIFVGQLDPYTTTEQDVRARFKKYGEIEHLQFVNKAVQGGAFRPAFAFIKFSNVESANEAVEQEVN